MKFALVLLFVGCAVAGPSVSRSRTDIESFRTFLENARRDDGILLETRMLANPKASAWENSGKLQGDILLNDEQAEMILQQYSAGRNAYIWPNTKWPSNTIVYEIASGFTIAQINAINWAISDIQANTCIRFRLRNNSDRVFVRVTGNSDGCYANVGYWASMGVHTLNLARNTVGRGCFIHTTIVHEWLHIIGFLHMQSTHNRDDWVRIMWQNIWQGMEHNFDKYGTNIVNNMGLPYEYASTMHYGRFGFSTNGQPTMVPIYDDRGLMGQQSFVSAWDWLRVNRHYNCPGAWSEKIDVEEPYQGINKSDDQLIQAVAEELPQEEAVVEVPQEVLSEQVSVVDEA